MGGILNNLGKSIIIDFFMHKKLKLRFSIPVKNRFEPLSFARRIEALLLRSVYRGGFVDHSIGSKLDVNTSRV